MCIGCVTLPEDTEMDSRLAPSQPPARVPADLAHLARLSTTGKLAASIAHEIKQPLAAITIQANACLLWLKRGNPDLDEVREGLARIEQAAMRAGDVIRALRTLAERSEPQPAEVDIDSAIEEVLTLARSEIRRHEITLHSDLDTRGRSVIGDRVQLQQVLLNLIMNSVEAMRATVALPRVLSVSTQLGETGDVLVTVEDTGPGIDPAIGHRIFDSLFTTKPDGLGMGLATCRSIIDAHGGRLWASPRAPHGTIFRFIVPGTDGMEQP
jgi:C4-dicarboxylate-specific signal transduction histidine kinase